MSYLIEEYIGQVFLNAKSSGEENWKRLSLSDLKIRLLKSTDNKFVEKDYGASSFKEFIKKYPDLLVLDEDAKTLYVEYIGDSEGEKITLHPSFNLNIDSIYENESCERIRIDLWNATLDYISGAKYVWDLNDKVAKKTSETDETNLFPTLTEAEINRWRNTFAEQSYASANEEKRDKLNSWVDHKLPTKSLPTSLRRKWKKFKLDNVIERLESMLSNGNNLDDKIRYYKEKNYYLAVGELYITKLDNLNKGEDDEIFAKACASWAAYSPIASSSESIQDIINNLNRFVPNQLAISAIHVIWRFQLREIPLPAQHSDLVYRITENINEIYNLGKISLLAELVSSAVTYTEQAFNELVRNSQAFIRTTPVTAKTSSIILLRSAHKYKQFALHLEQPLLQELDVLLGTVFRKFCEDCERHNHSSVIRRAKELTQHLDRFQESFESDVFCKLSNSIISPVIEHVSNLIEEGTQKSDAESKPHLTFFGRTIKLDLRTGKDEAKFLARVSNDGQGKAHGIRLLTKQSEEHVQLAIDMHVGEFDLAPGSERVVTLVLSSYPSTKEFSIPIQWVCTNSSGKTISFDDVLHIKQQNEQPIWNELVDNPPYVINPIRKREDLYGRDKILDELELNIASGTSTFLYGQKRVGKTSVLQVVASNINRRKNTVSVILRMGELTSLHEGQIAHTIAIRLVNELGITIGVPKEEDFGAGLGRLIPFIDEIAKKEPEYKFVVIIDEFDDIDPAFYSGERGKQFVKALRSLSEVGLIFFFVGSERMESIYRDHASDLNKWISISLDRITSEVDCKSLIAKPVSGAIEYEPEAINEIVNYCKGNPFYMHLFCSAVFKRCWQDKRTYVGSSDLEVIRRELIDRLSQTNFAHFWEDNPVLSLSEKHKQSAENCLFLCCMNTLGGSYESIDEIMEAQSLLQLVASQRVIKNDMKNIEARLLVRNVIMQSDGQETITTIALPFCGDWLRNNATGQLLPIWLRYCEEVSKSSSGSEEQKIVYIENTIFPIDEDSLLSISEKLVYLGKQIDVAQIKVWLKQFDDDNRVEIAYLLLKRLAEKGFVDSGKNVVTLLDMERAIRAKRLKVGSGEWKVVRKRLDNLCITFVDSDVKSGAVTARELAKRLSPGKCSSSTGITQWLEAHKDDDPLLVFVDDFSGSGDTIIKGLKKFWKNHDEIMNKLAKEGRVLCCIQTALPEAVKNINEEFNNVDVLVMDMFDNEVIALDKDASIFEDDAERKFAQEILLQIGRQLQNQNPLGHKDMGALISFHNSIPNNTLPIFWSDGTVNGRPWKALLPRASFG